MSLFKKNSIKKGLDFLINPKGSRIITEEIHANLITIILIIYGIFTMIFNHLAGLVESTYISGFMLVISIVYFLLFRFTKHFKFIIISGYFFLIIVYNLYYIYNYGITGPMAYYSFLIVYVTLYYSKVTNKLLLFFFFFINIVVLYYLDYQSDTFTNKYENFNQLFIDNVASILALIITFLILLRSLIKAQIKEKEIANESSHLKSTFLANTSHDLRAPVNSILSFSELIFQEKLTHDELIKYNKIIHSNSAQLLSLINDMFDISIIESKNIIINQKFTNINDLLDELHSTFKRDIEVKNKNIDLNIHYGLPNSQAFIYTDPVRVKQIISNLLQNAIKHTTEGAIAFGYDKKMDADELLFYVKDTGSGIPDDKLEDIFKRYVTNINETKKTKGTGLGLHITSSLVKLLNGKIWVESDIDVGSQFFFTLPINE